MELDFNLSFCVSVFCGNKLTFGPDWIDAPSSKNLIDILIMVSGKEALGHSIQVLTAKEKDFSEATLMQLSSSLQFLHKFGLLYVNFLLKDNVASPTKPFAKDTLNVSRCEAERDIADFPTLKFIFDTSTSKSPEENSSTEKQAKGNDEALCSSLNLKRVSPGNETCQTTWKLISDQKSPSGCTTGSDCEVEAGVSVSSEDSLEKEYQKHGEETQLENTNLQRSNSDVSLESLDSQINSECRFGIGKETPSPPPPVPVKKPLIKSRGVSSCRDVTRSASPGRGKLSSLGQRRPSLPNGLNSCRKRSDCLRKTRSPLTTDKATSKCGLTSRRNSTGPRSVNNVKSKVNSCPPRNKAKGKETGNSSNLVALHERAVSAPPLEHNNTPIDISRIKPSSPEEIKREIQAMDEKHNALERKISMTRKTENSLKDANVMTFCIDEQGTTPKGEIDLLEPLSPLCKVQTSPSCTRSSVGGSAFFRSLLDKVSLPTNSHTEATHTDNNQETNSRLATNETDSGSIGMKPVIFLKEVGKTSQVNKTFVLDDEGSEGNSPPKKATVSTARAENEKKPVKSVVLKSKPSVKKKIELPRSNSSRRKPNIDHKTESTTQRNQSTQIASNTRGSWEPFYKSMDILLFASLHSYSEQLRNLAESTMKNVSSSGNIEKNSVEIKRDDEKEFTGKQEEIAEIFKNLRIVEKHLNGINEGIATNNEEQGSGKPKNSSTK